VSEPTALLCVCCPVLRPKGRPRRPNTPQVCDGCRERLSGDLSGLPETYALVDADPVRGTSEIRSREYESRPPLNIAALSLLGRGSVIPSTDGRHWPQDQLGTVPPLDLLGWWVEDWITTRAMREQMPAMVMTTVTTWLSLRLDWACDQHLAIDEFAQDVRQLASQLRPFAGKDGGTRVGNCPRAYGDDRCNTPLYVDPYVNEIRCTRCKQTWRRQDGEWMHLRAQQLAAGVEAA